MKIFIFSLFLIMNSVHAQIIIGEPELTFTGYKFTNKEGVSGSFKKIEWMIPKAKDYKEQIKKTKLEIDSYSIDAGNEARNTNITNGLFKHWGEQKIRIKVTSYDEKTGLVTAQIRIGKSKNKVFFQTYQKENHLFFKASFDLLNFGFHQAFQKLSEICGPLHTGEDGVAKTWSTIDLEVKAALTKDSKS